MKFSEHTDDQKEALKCFHFQNIEFYKQEEMFFIQIFFKMLLVANGSAIFLLCAYIGSLVGSDNPSDLFTLPLVLFLLGLISAGYIIQYTLNVITTSRSNVTRQVYAIFKDELDVDQFESWGFSKKGLVIVGTLKFISSACFLLGVTIVFFKI